MNGLNRRSGTAAVSDFTSSVLSLLNGIDNKADMRLFLANLSPAVIQQIVEAATTAEHYELCQFIKECLPETEGKARPACGTTVFRESPDSQEAGKPDSVII